MVSLIIVEYKSMRRTLDYIDSFLENVSGSQNVNIIIIDNSESQENYKIIKKLNSNNKYFDMEFEDKNIEVLNTYDYYGHNLISVKTNENLGYAKGNNLGARISNFFFKDKYYIFSNNDLEFNEEININELLKPFNKSDVAVVGPRIIGLDGKDQSPRKYNNIWKQCVFYYYNILLFNVIHKFTSNMDYNSESHYAYWVMGCFLIVDSAKFNSVGMFDEDTFLFAEEMILAERLNENGYKNFFLNEITLIHNHGETVRNSIDILKGIEISFNSNLYYFEKYKQTSKIVLQITKWNFKLFKLLFPFREYIKRMMRKFI